MSDDENPVFEWKSAEGEKAAFVKHSGEAEVSYENGDSYKGHLNKHGEKHGYGRYEWSTREGAHEWRESEEIPEAATAIVYYEGNYQQGKRQGFGKMQFPDGSCYEGMWHKNRMHGDGTYTYKSGVIYSGHWRDGIRQGFGILVEKHNGEVVSQLMGDWVAGELVEGRIVYSNGSCFVGAFKDNRPCGAGKFYFPNGNMQEGEWVEEPKEDEEDPTPAPRHWVGGKLDLSDKNIEDLVRKPMDVENYIPKMEEVEQVTIESLQSDETREFVSLSNEGEATAQLRGLIVGGNAGLPEYIFHEDCSLAPGHRVRLLSGASVEDMPDETEEVINLVWTDVRRWKDDSETVELRTKMEDGSVKVISRYDPKQAI